MGRTDEFLSSISGFLRAKDAAQLQQWLVVEPPLADAYAELSRELKTIDIDKAVEKIDNDDAWPGFIAFMTLYLDFFRRVDYGNLMDTHTQLSALVNSCITAMSNASYGILVLPTTIQLCTALATLAMTLDKRPDLTRRWRAADDGEARKTLVEGTAESIQRAFTICLTERTSNRDGVKDGKPEGKKVGIYSFANLVLKLLFRCQKTPLAEQLFTNIMQNSPPLALYPASHRVMYLYYLGRFLFSNTHFYKAHLCLQSAYTQCHAQCINQRRNILIYLITTSLILGRHPSPALLARPEASTLYPKFAPVIAAMRTGNLAAYRHALGPTSPHHAWFLRRGILLPLLYRGDALVWRSLARRSFLLTYHVPADTTTRKAPTLDLHALLLAAQLCQRTLEAEAARQGRKLQPSMGLISGSLMPDITDVEAIVASLVAQDLLHGFVSHSLKRFAILGAKQKGGALAAGFPAPWGVMKTRAGGERVDVPGWVSGSGRPQVRMGGVVNLSGIARPVGSG
ncbi:hypothetical protein V502_02607 [Pseudogymnoascus sp. VKM F-4520 (FW-2644)]|nr:hypothetical protein V502_02607 [Pseudogymnoascus sp. VKM F-4520 (FW-2644)]